MGTLLKNTEISEKPGKKKKKILLTIVSLLICLVMVTPFVYMLSASFKYSADVTKNPLQLISDNPTLKNYIEVFSDQSYFRWFLNTFIVEAAVIVFTFLVVSLAAYGFARLEFRGKNVLFMYIVAGMMVPADLTIIARYLEFRYMGLVNSLLVLIIPALFNAWLLFVLRQFFVSIPMELTEAALIDGCGHLKIWYRIVLPLSKSAVTTVVVFCFIWTWNNYLEPSVFIMDMDKQVLAVGIKYFAQSMTGAGTNVPLLMAASCISMIPVLIIFLLMQDQLIEGIASSGIKG